MSNKLIRIAFIFITLCIASIAQLRGDEAIRLHEAFPAGYQYHVSTRVDLTGTLELQPEKGQAAGKSLTITGGSAIDYDEKVLDSSAENDVRKTVRIFRRMDMRRKVGDEPQEITIRPAVRRMVLLRLKNKEVPFSPDGPLTWSELDVVRTDVFTPALGGLLSSKDVRPGDTWTAASSAVLELTDMEQIDLGSLECKFEEFTTLASRRHARIAFRGTVQGMNEDGPNRQQLDGYFYFDLESNHLSYLSMQGKSDLLDKAGKTVGSVQGRFVITRQANRKSADLTEDALKGIALEPTAENTLLLYDSMEMGLRFFHPRRWKVAGVHGKQVDLDERNGSGLRISVESGSTLPSTAQFVKESEQALQAQKIKIVRQGQPGKVQNSASDLEHFEIDTELNGQKARMSYYLLRQGKGGVTIAARLTTGDLEAQSKEVEGIARSIILSTNE